MKAMVLHDTAPVEEHPLKYSEMPEQTPGPGQVKLRVLVCGVCRTDLHTVEGDLNIPEFPVIPGHQVVGIVKELGKNVTHFQIGQRVGVPWLYLTCGTCSFCRTGYENLCHNARFTGLHAYGGYADEIIVYAGYIYPLPGSLSHSEVAPLLCGGIIGYRALKLSEIKKGQRLGLYGFGGSAHITIQVAVSMGCEVFVFTRSEGHRELARKLGAVWTGKAGDSPGVKMQGSIIFAPAGWLVKDALEELDRGGTLSIAGVTMTPIPELNYDTLLYWERTIRSVANFTRQDAEEFLKIAGELPVKTSVTTYPLVQANKALLDLKKSRIDGMGVLVVAEE
jgi:propanol-preferring alcohol dehydrogenase